MDRLNKKVKSFLRPWKPPTWVPEDFPDIPETKLKVKQSILDQSCQIRHYSWATAYGPYASFKHSLIDKTEKIGGLFLFFLFSNKY